jgi:hypothetical protein
MAKKWYASKTMWANIIALGLLITGNMFNIEYEPEVAIGLLALVNLILRAITKEPLWE